MAALTKLPDLIGKLAPALATGLTGGLAPAVIGILAEVFGTKPSEEELVAKMAASNPEVLQANLARAEAAFRADAERSISLQKQIDANVEMMRMSMGAGWFHTAWRPMAGWVAILFYTFWAALVIKEGFSGTFAALAQVGNILMLGGPMMAVAGIVAWQKSEERKAIANSSASLGDVVRTVLGK